MRTRGYCLILAACLAAGALPAPPAAAVQTASSAELPVVDGYDADGRRIRVKGGQRFTVRIPARIWEGETYRLAPVAGVRQIGPSVHYRYPPSDGVGFTQAYDVTSEAEREGQFQIDIHRVIDATGQPDGVSRRFRFLLIAVAP